MLSAIASKIESSWRVMNGEPVDVFCRANEINYTDGKNPAFMLETICKKKKTKIF